MSEIHAHYCYTCHGYAPCGGPLPKGDCLLVDSCPSCGTVPEGSGCSHAARAER
jgi:hypothetical protein